LECDVLADGIELDFEVCGEIAVGPDPRLDLAFGLTGIAVAERGNVAAQLAFMEARLGLMEAPRVRSGHTVRLVASTAPGKSLGV
jgi:hypothetical protein